MKRVLIITSPRDDVNWLESSSDVARGLLGFVEATSDRRQTVSVTTVDRLLFRMGDELSVWDNYNKRDLADYDLIHIRGAHHGDLNLLDFIRTIGLYAEHKKVELIDSIDVWHGSNGKLSQMMQSSINDISVPNTISAWRGGDLVDHAVDLQQYPIIIKANIGMKGQDNHLIKSSSEARELLERSVSQYVVQQYIPNSGDYRVLFLGNHSSPLIFKRTPSGHSHLNNTSRGGSAVLQESIPKEAFDMSVKAARLSGRTVAGVDIIQNSETGEWLLLEVNSNPALSMGVFYSEKVDAYRNMLNSVLERDS